MRSIENTKGRIKSIVDLYKAEFEEEYLAVTEQLATRRKLNVDQFASLKGEHNFKRKLLEMPETLWTMFHQGLDGEELEWLYELNSQKWFAKLYPEFRAGEEI